MRYHSTFASNDKSVSLEDYVKSMKQGQKKIYFIAGMANPVDAMQNPFMEPFKDSDVPVLIVGN
jgi:HSP90 family molecular chaperone